MQRHLLTLRYSGLLADQGAMDVTMAGAVQVGVRRLLSASAHYYLYGLVPVRLVARSRDFAIVELPTEPGSIIRNYAIVMADTLAGAAVYDLLKDGPSLNSVIIFAAASAVKIFLERDQWAIEIGSLLRRQPAMPTSRIEEPLLPWPVKEPTLSKHRGNDRFEQAGPSPEHALIDRTIEALEGLAHPI